MSAVFFALKTVIVNIMAAGLRMTHVPIVSLWCRPVYPELKSGLIYQSVALSFPPRSCFVVNLLCSTFNLKK